VGGDDSILISRVIPKRLILMHTLKHQPLSQIYGTGLTVFLESVIYGGGS
jgi:hypothetical protein